MSLTKTATGTVAGKYLASSPQRETMSVYRVGMSVKGFRYLL